MQQSEKSIIVDEFRVESVAAARRALGNLSPATFWRRSRDPKALALGFPRPIKICGRSVVIVAERQRYIKNLVALRDHPVEKKPDVKYTIKDLGSFGPAAPAKHIIKNGTHISEQDVLKSL